MKSSSTRRGLILDFAGKLRSGSVRQQLSAATHLQWQGEAGYEHVPALLEVCKSVNLPCRQLSQIEEKLLERGARAVVKIINAVGYDEAEPLHREVLDWLANISESQSSYVAASATWAIGDLQAPPGKVVSQLEKLIASERRPDENRAITCRGIAFRILARLDRARASRFVDTPACKEYLNAIEIWTADHGAYDRSVREELTREAAWLNGY